MKVFGIVVKNVTVFCFVAKDAEDALDMYGLYVTQNGYEKKDARLFQFRKETVKQVVDLKAFYTVNPKEEIAIDGKVETQGMMFSDDSVKKIEGRETWKREQKTKGDKGR